MGKWTDKGYITHSEWVRDFGGTSKRREAEYKRLPYNFCALSLAAFEDPVGTEDGVVFDRKHLMPFIKKFGVHPVTGTPLTADKVIPLHFHKNGKGEYHDPVSFKVFNETTHIVAVRTSGNVYTMETIEQFNAKVKNWRDLLTDEPFQRKDIITIQDPTNLDYRRDFSKYYHVLNHISVTAEEEARLRKQVTNHINLDPTAQRVLKMMPKEDQPSSAASLSSATSPPSTTLLSSKNKPINASHFSTGNVAASFTSTAVDIQTQTEVALWEMDDVMYSQIKEKGYVRMTTNLGDLNVELHSDLAPMTCHNFILLAQRGYYKNIKFHRSIKNFMIQGGDPTGTGNGGESVWKGTFKDELRQKLSHDSRGVLSMANRGKNTNGSQFFFTFKPCKHLDMKHTIFGKVVGGLEVLGKMESIETDDADKPKQPILIRDITVLVDPYENWKKNYAEKQRKEAEAKEHAKLLKDTKGKDPSHDILKGAWFTTTTTVRPVAAAAPAPATAAGAGETTSSVGRYLPVNPAAAAAAAAAAVAAQPGAAPSLAAAAVAAAEDDDYAFKKRKVLRNTLSDFSAW